MSAPRRQWPLLLGLVIAGCATAPPPQPMTPPPAVVVQPSRPVPPAPPAAAAAAPLTLRYQRVDWTALPGWATDNLAPAWQAFLNGCTALRTRPDWQVLCTQAMQQPQRDARAVRQFFESQFEPWRIAYDDETGKPSDTGLITGYYEPVLRGARKASGVYATPLYAVPDDLLTVELGDLYPSLKGERVRGRLQGRKVLPYPERAATTAHAPLRGKELVWVDDPVDAFFLQVQGSGRVTLPDGKVVRLAYADQNGQPYKAIARYLVQRGELTVEQATAPGLREWLRNNPKRLDEVLNTNPSVVFFREEPITDPALGPKGALGVPLTAGRSVAVDPRNLPLGAPLFLATTVPGSNEPLQRLVMAQDTGGAIRGVVRADLFEGLGAGAGERAGLMRQQGRLWLLWPKGRALPPPGPGVAPAAAPAAASSAVLLQTLLQPQQVGGRRIVVDARAPAQLRVVQGADTSSWSGLLAVLRANGLAVFSSAGSSHVVPEADIRSQPLPVVTADDAGVADDEWVTRTLALRYLDAAQLVPVLRPLLAQQGHLAAVPGANALLVVDRLANTRRLAATLREMDKPPMR